MSIEPTNQIAIGEQDKALDRTLRTLVGYNIKRSYILLRDEVLDVLTPYGLRSTSFSALVIIADNLNLSQSQLADALQIKRSGVVLIVDELEQLELITRNKVPGDRRSYALTATMKGMHLKEKVVREVRNREQQFFSALTQEESAFLGQLFSKVGAIENLPSKQDVAQGQ